MSVMNLYLNSGRKDWHCWLLLWVCEKLHEALIQSELRRLQVGSTMESNCKYAMNLLFLGGMKGIFEGMIDTTLLKIKSFQIVIIVQRF